MRIPKTRGKSQKLRQRLLKDEFKLQISYIGQSGSKFEKSSELQKRRVDKMLENLRHKKKKNRKKDEDVETPNKETEDKIDEG